MSAVPAPAVRVYGRDDPRLSGKLRGRLMQERLKLAEQVAAGGAVDWPDYQHRVGRIRGIQDAIDICAEIEREQEKR